VLPAVEARALLRKAFPLFYLFVMGMPVTVSPDVNGGEQPVAGTVRFANAETIVIDRHTEEVSNVCVHFPRAGYRVDVVN
jgi:glutathione S-transferase